MAPPDRYQISLIFTDACNMRCAYCTTAKRPATVDSRLLTRVVGLLERTAPARLDLNYHGGEPTLAWDMVEELTARLAPLQAGRSISLNLCTNGTRLDLDRARFLATHDFNVRISIDGRRATHTAARRAAGTTADEAGGLYDATLTGLRALAEAGVRSAANMVVTPASVSDLTRNAIFLINEGLFHLCISPVVGQAWTDEALLELDRQLRMMPEIWRGWLAGKGRRRAEDLRRSLLSEYDRARYCEGGPMNQPDGVVLVIGPDGRIFGDEPDVRTEAALVVGHIDQIDSLAALPRPPRTAFQLMYDREFYPAHVLRDVRRTHRLLALRTAETYRQLFGADVADAARR